MLDSIGELPSHPLFVHAPIVGMPLLFLFALALAARPQWRRQVGWSLPVITAGVLIATFLAKFSGEGLEEFLGDFAPNTTKHVDLANTTLVFIGALLVVGVALVVADRRASAGGPTWLNQASVGLMGLAVLLSGLATAWMFRTGHEGARLVWKGTVQSVGLFLM